MTTIVAGNITHSVFVINKVNSDEFIVYLRYVFLYTCNPITIVFGLFSNIFNVIVFTRMGLKDGVRLSLFSLAISDFFFLLVSTLIPSTNIVANFPRIAPQTINLPDVAYAGFWYSMVFYDASMMIRVYTAVARACCVAIPLTFKNIFTKKVTMYSVGAVFTVALVTRVPMLACQGFKSVFDGKTNVTKLALYFTPLRPAAFAVNDILNRNIITWGSISLVLVSLFVLKFKLISAAKFRHGTQSGKVESEPIKKAGKIKTLPERRRKLKPKLLSTSHEESSIHENSVTHEKSVTHEDSVTHDKSATHGKSNNFLVGKDLQVLRVVVLVSVIFIVCSLPQAVAGVVRRLVPDYNTGGLYGNVFLVTSVLFDISSYLNSSLNIFVYYNFNTKFRLVCRRLLSFSEVSKN